MTEAEKQKALEEARAAGIDLDQLDRNLAMSPAERLRQHELRLNRIEKMEAALGRKKDLLTAKELRAIAAKRGKKRT